jgi:hypothetical protein
MLVRGGTTMNRIARAAMALAALAIPVASIAVVEVSTQTTGVAVADSWCC